MLAFSAIGYEGVTLGLVGLIGQVNSCFRSPAFDCFDRLSPLGDVQWCHFTSVCSARLQIKTELAAMSKKMEKMVPLPEPKQISKLSEGAKRQGNYSNPNHYTAIRKKELTDLRTTFEVAAGANEFFDGECDKLESRLRGGEQYGKPIKPVEYEMQCLKDAVKSQSSVLKVKNDLIESLRPVPIWQIHEYRHATDNSKQAYRVPRPTFVAGGRHLVTECGVPENKVTLACHIVHGMLFERPPDEPIPSPSGFRI